MNMLTPTARLFAAATIAAVLSVSASAIELTTNGGFETGDTSGWTSFVGPPATFGVTGDAATGSFAGDINNTAQGTGQVVKQANIGVGTVTAGQTLYIKFDAKGNLGPGGVAFAEFFSEIDGGGVSSSQILGGGPLPLTNAYQSFAFTVVTGGDVSGGVTLQFNPATGAFQGSTAQLFIDNVSVNTEIPEPASLALLALGSVAMIGRRKRPQA